MCGGDPKDRPGTAKETPIVDRDPEGRRLLQLPAAPTAFELRDEGSGLRDLGSRDWGSGIKG